MMNKSDIFVKLSKYGLNQDEKLLYVTLIEHGQATPLTLSRQTRKNRTTIYRILEALTVKGLVRQIMAHKSTLFEAAPPAALATTITSLESRLEEMKKTLPELENAINSLTTIKKTAVDTKYYRGRAGLKQLLYNTLQSKTEVIGFGSGNWNEGIGKKAAERLREEYVVRGIKTREILNRADLTGSYTQVTGYFDNIYEHRVISQKLLTITSDTYIYNDVYSLYHTVSGEYFGVEIKSPDIAATQKQLFEIVWTLSKPLKI